MSDKNKELFWSNYGIIGYVPLDEKGEPYQPNLGSGWRSRKKPITVYKTLARAKKYSPVDSAKEVRMFTENEV